MVFCSGGGGDTDPDYKTMAFYIRRHFYESMMGSFRIEDLVLFSGNTDTGHGWLAAEVNPRRLRLSADRPPLAVNSIVGSRVFECAPKMYAMSNVLL